MKSGFRSFRTIVRAAGCLGRSIGATYRRLLRAIPPEGSPTFVLYSIIPWDGVWQRPQHFAERLARRHPVIYVDPIGIQHIESGHHHPVLRCIHESLFVLQPHVLPGGKTNSWISRMNDPIIIDHISDLLHDQNLSRPVLISNTPFADGIARHPLWRMVVYDVIDDFISTSWAPPDAAARERRLFSAAQTVFTGTYSLSEKKRGMHPEIEYIPCGVETDHFSKANLTDIPLPEDIRSIPRPILGYFGALNERIDADLIVHLANAMPHASIVLIGPIMADFGLSDFEPRWASVFNSTDQPGFRMKPMPPNIHVLGIRSYRDLPSYLKAFDLCLMPYVINDVTRDIHPVKILEYLVSGRPVVSTAVPDVERFYTGLTDIARSHEEFCTLVRKNLESDTPAAAQARIAFARSKSWEDMSDRMLANILRHMTHGVPTKS